MSVSPLRRAPFIGFNGALFALVPDDNGIMRDWDVPTFSSSRHIPGSRITVTQTTGSGPAIVTWRVRCDTQDDFATLQSTLQTIGTLTVFARMSRVRGDVRSVQGTVYEYLAGVLLVAIAGVEFSIDGYVEADCTFQRAFNPLTGGTS